MSELRAALLNIPIYYISTHGSYDIEKKEPTLYNVPENTYVFEAATAGEYTLANMDPILRPLAKGNRKEFIDYFLAEKKPADFNDRKAAVFGNLTFYMSGDKMYNRKLQIGQGIYTFRLRAISNSKGRPIQGLGVFKFSVNGKEEDILYPELLNLSDSKKSIDSGQLIALIRENDPDALRGAIYIFSSCAVPNCNKGKDCLRRLELIETKQRDQKLKLLAMGIYSPQGENAYVTAEEAVAAEEGNNNEEYHHSAFGRKYGELTEQMNGLNDAAMNRLEKIAVKKKRNNKKAVNARCWSRVGSWLCGTRKVNGGRPNKTRRHR